MDILIPEMRHKNCRATPVFDGAMPKTAVRGKNMGQYNFMVGSPAITNAPRLL